MTNRPPDGAFSAKRVYWLAEPSLAQRILNECPAMVQSPLLTYLNHDTSGSDLNHLGRSLFLASDVGGSSLGGVNFSEILSMLATVRA